MKFFKIRLRVRELFDEDKTYSPQEIVGAKDKETAIELTKREWNDCDYEVLEVRYCEEVFPDAVFCTRIIKGEWSR